MKPEKILQSDVIDIIFENRNKEYGAYELRKHYNNRIGKAMGITTLIVVAFGLMQSFKVPQKKGSIADLDITPVTLIADKPKPPEEKEKEKPKETIKEKPIEQPKDFQQVKSTTIDIVKDNLVKDIIPTNETLDNKVLGKNNTDGEATDPGENIGPKSKGSGDTGEVLEVPEVAAGPISIAEFMPQFPGGHDAFIKFMQRNLRQPDDFEDGQKMTITARFVVNAEGEIVDIDITQNGRKDLDAEVIRVIKKMPRWTPGMQNGRKVAVYYKVPVTFVAPE